MTQRYLPIIIVVLVSLITLSACQNNPTQTKVVEIKVTDPLPSWNDGDTKQAIIDYVTSVTDKQSNHYIPIEDRIATFDNDGNLWAEQPAYFQLFFTLNRIKELAADHPEWKTEQPYKAAIENDMHEIAKQGHDGLLKLVMAAHAGISTVEFDAIVKKWVTTEMHPTKNVRFDQLVYQPMLELLRYLRDNDFQTYIVSGGGVDFMRAIVTEIYGIPSEKILGSRIVTEFQYNDGDPKIIRLPELEYNNDKAGKPLNIQKIIGKKTVFASGNSDGDLQMMQWTASNDYEFFNLYLHHTDSVREWAYDRDSHIGRLDKGLDQAIKDGWTVIDMEKDWKVIFPYELD
ncbi:HAD family hydrolase [Labilibacter marinus]|uniref:HAD family hydrolase n=1 Tax=Labilibacter marinus TaxID=1477105 RepID=UPI00094FCBEE|nr:HAD family hydrolase [Labilibacter marinus]